MREKPSSFILAIAAGCALLSISCGPKNNESAPTSEQRAASAPSSTPAAPPDTRPAIVAFGDSLTAGVAGRSYPEQLQDLVDAAKLNYHVDNQGVSGDTSTDGLARVANVLGSHPALVIVEFGGNDGLRGIPIEATRKNLAQILETIKSAHVPEVLLGITLPPNYGPEYVKPFTAMFPALAKQYRVPYLPFLLAHVYQNQALMQPDGIHPNGDGNRIVAGDVFPLIRPLLK